MNSRVFITGGTGLLGRQILHRFFEEGCSLTALKRETSNTDGLPNQIHWVQGDLNRPATYLSNLQQADLVIHSAAKVSFNPKRKNQTIQFNVRTTETIAEACLEAGIPLVHISSVSALGSLSDHSIDETSSFSLNATNTAYAKSKYLSEQKVWACINKGLRAVILNPSIIIGIPAKWHESSGSFWQQIDQGLSYAPTGVTGFVDARDVAEVALQLVRQQQYGQSFLVNAENLGYQNFFQMIADSLGKEKKVKVFPKWMSELLWPLATVVRKIGLKVSLTKALHQTIHQKFYYDNSKVKNALDVEFRPVEESIKWVSERYLQDLSA